VPGRESQTVVYSDMNCETNNPNNEKFSQTNYPSTTPDHQQACNDPGRDTSLPAIEELTSLDLQEMFVDHLAEHLMDECSVRLRFSHLTEASPPPLANTIFPTTIVTQLVHLLDHKEDLPLDECMRRFHELLDQLEDNVEPQMWCVDTVAQRFTLVFGGEVAAGFLEYRRLIERQLEVHQIPFGFKVAGFLIDCALAVYLLSSFKKINKKAALAIATMLSRSKSAHDLFTTSQRLILFSSVFVFVSLVTVLLERDYTAEDIEGIVPQGIEDLLPDVVAQAQRSVEWVQPGSKNLLRDTARSLSQVSSLASAVTNLSRVFTLITSLVKDWVEHNTLDPVGSLVSKAQKMIADLNLEGNKTPTPAQVMELRQLAQRLDRLSLRPGQSPTLHKTVDHVKSLLALVDGAALSAVPIPEPYVVYLTGPPGVGKTTVAKIIVPYLFEKLTGKPYSTADSYSVPPAETKFFNGYMGQRVFWFDDYKVPRDGAEQFATFFLRLINTSRCLLDTARLESKDVSYADPLLGIILSNEPDFSNLATLPQSTIDAIHRRVSMRLSVHTEGEQREDMSHLRFRQINYRGEMFPGTPVMTLPQLLAAFDHHVEIRSQRGASFAKRIVDDLVAYSGIHQTLVTHPLMARAPEHPPLRFALPGELVEPPVAPPAQRPQVRAQGADTSDDEAASSSDVNATGLPDPLHPKQIEIRVTEVYPTMVGILTLMTATVYSDAHIHTTSTDRAVLIRTRLIRDLYTHGRIMLADPDLPERFITEFSRENFDELLHAYSSVRLVSQMAKLSVDGLTFSRAFACHMLYEKQLPRMKPVDRWWSRTFREVTGPILSTQKWSESLNTWVYWLKLSIGIGAAVAAATTIALAVSAFDGDSVEPQSGNSGVRKTKRVQQEALPPPPPVAPNPNITTTAQGPAPSQYVPYVDSFVLLTAVGEKRIPMFGVAVSVDTLLMPDHYRKTILAAQSLILTTRNQSETYDLKDESTLKRFRSRNLDGKDLMLLRISGCTLPLKPLKRVVRSYYDPPKGNNCVLLHRDVQDRTVEESVITIEAQKDISYPVAGGPRVLPIAYAYTTPQARVGTCGGMIVNPVNDVVGIHVAGSKSNNAGYAAPISWDEITTMLQHCSFAPFFSVSAHDLIDTIRSPMGVPEMILPLSVASPLPASRTRLVANPVLARFYETFEAEHFPQAEKRGIPHLTWFVKDNHSHHPLIDGLHAFYAEQYLKSFPPEHRELVHGVAFAFSDHLVRFVRETPRPLTLPEVILGSKALGVKPLDPRKSAGSNSMGYTLKGDAWKWDGTTLHIDPRLETEFNRVCALLEKGHNYSDVADLRDQVFRLALKDEKRVYELDTLEPQVKRARIFYVGPLLHALVKRRYLSFVQSAIQTDPVGTMLGVGLSPVSPAWTEWGCYLSQSSTLGLDFSRYDTSSRLRKERLLTFKRLGEATGASQQHVTAIQSLQMKKQMGVVGSVVLDLKDSLLSGESGTSYEGGAEHVIALASAVCLTRGITPDAAVALLRDSHYVTYSDDGAGESKFSQTELDQITTHLKSFGYNPTGTTKSSPPTNIPFSETQFLSRRFLWSETHQRYLAPLKPSSLNVFSHRWSDLGERAHLAAVSIPFLNEISMYNDVLLYSAAVELIRKLSESCAISPPPYISLDERIRRLGTDSELFDSVYDDGWTPLIWGTRYGSLTPIEPQMYQPPSDYGGYRPYVPKPVRRRVDFGREELTEQEQRYGIEAPRELSGLAKVIINITKAGDRLFSAVKDLFSGWDRPPWMPTPGVPISTVQSSRADIQSSAANIATLKQMARFSSMTAHFDTDIVALGSHTTVLGRYAISAGTAAQALVLAFPATPFLTNAGSDWSAGPYPLVSSTQILAGAPFTYARWRALEFEFDWVVPALTSGRLAVVYSADSSQLPSPGPFDPTASSTLTLNTLVDLSCEKTTIIRIPWTSGQEAVMFGPCTWPAFNPTVTSAELADYLHNVSLGLVSIYVQQALFAQDGTSAKAQMVVKLRVDGLEVQQPTTWFTVGLEQTLPDAPVILPQMHQDDQTFTFPNDQDTTTLITHVSRTLPTVPGKDLVDVSRLSRPTLVAQGNLPTTDDTLVLSLELPGALIAASDAIARLLDYAKFIRADLKVRLELTANPGIAGHLMVAAIPTTVTDTTGYTAMELSMFAHSEVNLNGSTEHVFNIPYAGQLRAYPLTGPTADDIEDQQSLTSIQLRIFQIVAPFVNSGTAPTVRYALYVSFLDPHVRVPTHETVTLPTLNHRTSKTYRQRRLFQRQAVRPPPIGITGISKQGGDTLETGTTTALAPVDTVDFIQDDQYGRTFPERSTNLIDLLHIPNPIHIPRNMLTTGTFTNGSFYLAEIQVRLPEYPSSQVDNETPLAPNWDWLREHYMFYRGNLDWSIPTMHNGRVNYYTHPSFFNNSPMLLIGTEYVNASETPTATPVIYDVTAGTDLDKVALRRSIHFPLISNYQEFVVPVSSLTARRVPFTPVSDRARRNQRCESRPCTHLFIRHHSVSSASSTPALSASNPFGWAGTTPIYTQARDDFELSVPKPATGYAHTNPSVFILGVNILANLIGPSI
jgi:hypothetical protein